MDDDLGDGKIHSLERALLELKAELTAAWVHTGESAKTVSLDAPIGRLTRMDALQDQKLAQANKRRIELRLKQIQGALRRIEVGDFGYCLVCDEPIAVRRLEARPESPLCLRCQSTREQKH